MLGNCCYGMVGKLSQYSTVPYSTVQHRTVQYSAAQHRPVQSSLPQSNPVQFSTVQCSGGQPINWSVGRLVRWSPELLSALLGQCWDVLDALLGFCWDGLGALLGRGTMLERPGRVAGTLLGRPRRLAGTLLGRRCLAGTLLGRPQHIARRCWDVLGALVLRQSTNQAIKPFLAKGLQSCASSPWCMSQEWWILCMQQ